MASQSRPSCGSLLSVTNKGEVCVFDPAAMERSGTDAMEKKTQDDSVFTQSINIGGRSLPIIQSLENGFGVASSLFVQVKMQDDAARFSFNLHVGRAVPEADIAFHINPRLDQNKVVLNDRKAGKWGLEEMQPLLIMQSDSSAMKVFVQGNSTQLLIKCEAAYFQVTINGTPYARFKHRINPEEITHFGLSGDIEPQKIEYYSKHIILPPKEIYWRILGGGHLLQVESCTTRDQKQIIWGLGYDSRLWLYTGGWGGAHFKGVDSSKGDFIGPMEDARYYYVYENQRWNPLTGFTTHGLPTDRYSWSDRSGKISLTKDSVKLATIHWQWTSDWLIDFQTPGGVDHDGWQYATDFPASYHHKKRFTDYVRRRRWARKCKLTTSGPWRPLGATKLIDLTLKSHPNEDSVMMWAVTAKGEALFRTGVSSRCQEGLDWLHVTSDVPFQSITIGGQGNDKSPFKVWAVATDGSAFLRHGITDVAPVGQLWLQLHPPASSELRNVSAGDNSLWALDTCGRLWFRQEVNAVFPEGTSWSSVACASATGSAFTGGEVKAISACGKDLWAILDNILPISWGSSPAAVAVASAVGHAAAFGSVASAAINATGYTNGGPVNGVLVMRSGITPGAPMGVGWDIVIGGGWKDVTIRGRV